MELSDIKCLSERGLKSRGVYAYLYETTKDDRSVLDKTFKDLVFAAKREEVEVEDEVRRFVEDRDNFYKLYSDGSKEVRDLLKSDLDEMTNVWRDSEGTERKTLHTMHSTMHKLFVDANLAWHMNCNKRVAKEKAIQSLTKEISGKIHNYEAYNNMRDILANATSVASEENAKLDAIAKAKLLGFDNFFAENKDYAMDNLEYRGENSPRLCPNYHNYCIILQYDKYLNAKYIYNDFSNSIDVCTKDGFRPFKEEDVHEIDGYISTVYGFSNLKELRAALNKERVLAFKYHPLKGLIEKEDWDGDKRIDTFFQNVCGCKPKTEEERIYLREVARILFYGGISRLYSPGCKLDYMIVFAGPQGCGKSFLTRLLALQDVTFGELNSFEGDNAMRAVRGKWICEVPELLGLKRAKDVEKIKQFITTTDDEYVHKYEEQVSHHPRTCILIGTTNSGQFLNDPSGNRRFLPVHLDMNGEEMYLNRDKNREYILNCWREALYLLSIDDIYLSIPSKYWNILENARNAYTDSDPVSEMIESYLDEKDIGDKVFLLEIYQQCMQGVGVRNFDNMQKAKIRAILERHHNEWVKSAPDVRARYGKNNPTSFWEKVA